MTSDVEMSEGERGLEGFHELYEGVSNPPPPPPLPTPPAVSPPRVESLNNELAKITLRVFTVKLIAQAFCQAWGPPGCYCKGVDANCHAGTIYEKEARGATLLLERHGVLNDH